MIWIDLPSGHCLYETGKTLAPLECNTASKFIVVAETLSDASEEKNLVNIDRFMLKTSSGKCVVPNKQSIKLQAGGCDNKTDNFWSYTSTGQLQWVKSECHDCRKCLTGRKRGEPLEMKFCDLYVEDQNFEFGRRIAQDDGPPMLSPIDVEAWQLRQDKMRTEVMNREKVVVAKTLEEIDMDMALHEFDKTNNDNRRRAAVFYVDKGEGGLKMINWGIYTWKFIGLDSAEQGFDLVMMTHPAMVEKLPEECERVQEDYKIDYKSKGKCLFKPYLGISYRDKSYDGYMNGQECLYGPGTDFLSQYTLLLRADLDTFPTPHMLGYWPKGVVVDIQYSTNHGLDNIKQALRDLACSVGIEHREWFNMGSTWYGDGRRVRNLARLTVSLNKYGRAEMFGPGTACRCSTCHQLPKTCQWGGGPYAGTLLLYLQEIAMNKILTQTEWDSMPKGQLDQGVTDFKRNVCEPVVLHCFHNAELFSKNAFSAGKYKNQDLGELDMTNERDYATYMALVSSGQGKNSDKMLEKLRTTLGSKSWAEYCRAVNS